MSLINGLFDLSATDFRKLAVWNKGRVIAQHDPAIWRLDAHGNLIRYSDYGNRNSDHGWEIDHHPFPASLGGTDDLTNLRPLHCKANASHGGILGALLNR